MLNGRRNRRRIKSRRANGFTVLEFAVVMLLVTILTVVAGFGYRKHIVRSKLAECITQIQYLRRLALDQFYNEGQYPTLATILETTRDDPSLALFNYTVLSTGGPTKKKCNPSDTNKGHGNDCDLTDEDNTGASGGSNRAGKNGDIATVGGDLSRTGILTATPLRYGFEITCTHDHQPVAEYVYVNNTIPNAIIVQMTATNAP